VVYKISRDAVDNLTLSGQIFYHETNLVVTNVDFSIADGLEKKIPLDLPVLMYLGWFEEASAYTYEGIHIKPRLEPKSMPRQCSIQMLCLL
jgi:hypothetical protein